MHRTQIYMGEDEWSAVKWSAKSTGNSASEMIRAAVREVYMTPQKGDFDAVLDAVAGVWTDRTMKTDRFIRALRDDNRAGTR